MFSEKPNRNDKYKKERFFPTNEKIAIIGDQKVEII